MIRLRYFVCGILLTAAALATLASAQITQPVKFRAPLAFQAGSAVLPAGEYSVRPLNSNDEASVLLIESEDGHRAVVMTEKIATPTKTAAGTTMAKLERQGGAMRLTTIWIAGQSLGYKILGNGESVPALSARSR